MSTTINPRAYIIPGLSTPQVLLRLHYGLRQDLVIADRVKLISSRTPYHFHQHTIYPPGPPLHITPFNLISRMSRSGSYSKPTFIQCGWDAKFVAIFGLSLPDLTPYSTAYRKLVRKYLNAKMAGMGAEDLIPRIIMTEAISEVTQACNIW